MIDNSHVYHKKQDMKADREVILDGIPCIATDKYHNEMEKAMTKLVSMMKDFNQLYIRKVQRFLTADKDGFFPMKVVMWDPAVVKALVDHNISSPGKYPFFRQSKTRMVRIANGRELKKVEALNARLPETSPMIWESELMGGVIISEQVPNKKVPLPPIPAELIQAQGNQRPLYAYPQKYMYQPPPPAPPVVPQPLK